MSPSNQNSDSTAFGLSRCNTVTTLLGTDDQAFLAVHEERDLDVKPDLDALNKPQEKISKKMFRGVMVLLIIQVCHQALITMPDTQTFTKAASLRADAKANGEDIDVYGIGKMCKGFSALAAVMAGWMSDKVGRRPMIALSLMLTVMWIVLCWRADSAYMWCAGEIMHGLCLFQKSIYIALIVDMVPAATRSAYIAYVFAAGGIGYSIGARFGSFMGGFGDTMFLCSVVFISWLAMIAIWIVPEGNQDKKKAEKKTNKGPAIQITEEKESQGISYLVVVALMVVQLGIKVCWDFKDTTMPQWLNANYPETFDFTKPGPENDNTAEKLGSSRDAFGTLMMLGGFACVLCNMTIAYVLNPKMYGGEPSDNSFIMKLNRNIQGKDHVLAIFGVAVMGVASFLAMLKSEIWICWTMNMIFSAGLSFALVFISSIAARAAKGAQGTILSIVDMAKNGAAIFSPKLAQSLWYAGYGDYLKFISTGCAGVACLFILVTVWATPKPEETTTEEA